VEVSPEPGSASPSRHLHRRHAESFYVLDGELAITLGDRELRAQAGSWVQVPPGLPHTVSYPERVRFLAVHTPNCGFGAFLHALAESGDDARAAARAGFDEERAP
jgi:quercetin dioxygenase-like cupin family protein